MISVVLTGIIAYASFWMLGYLTVRRVVKLEAEAACRFLRGCHSIVVLMIYSVSQREKLFKDIGVPMTNSQILLITYSFGFYVFDFFWRFLCQPHEVTMLVQHFLTLYAVMRFLLLEICGTEVITSLAVLEVSTPVLQMRWLLRSLGYRGTTFCQAVEVSHVLTYFMFRIVGGAFACRWVFSYPLLGWEARFMAVLFYIVSWMYMLGYVHYWFFSWRINARKAERLAKKD